MHPAQQWFGKLELVELNFLTNFVHIWTTNQVVLHSNPTAERFNRPLPTRFPECVQKDAQHAACIIHLLRRLLESINFVQSLDCHIKVRSIKCLAICCNCLVLSFNLFNTRFYGLLYRENHIRWLAHQFTNSWRSLKHVFLCDLRRLRKV